MSEFDMTGRPPVDSMVAELLATGLLSDSDRTDLDTYLADWQAGRLDPDDLRYLTAFHARLVHGGPAEPVEPVASPQVNEWRQRAEAAEAEVARLQALLAQHGITDPGRASDLPIAQVEQ